MRTQQVLHRRKDEQARSAGFTMVELAVVIAMTGILTALLLPALSSAKEKSRRAVCRSNLKQLFLVCQYYADDNGDVLPSAADNVGNYHSIRLSDQTFTNLVTGYAGGCSNIFYCPNLAFDTGPNALPSHDAYGYIIGYSYLADNVLTTSKGADYSLEPVRFASGLGTTALLADANYWTVAQSGSIPVVEMAPHTSSGAAMAHLVSPSAPVVATNSASLGATGGNIELFNSSVTWRSIGSMQTFSASSANDAYGNW